MSELPSWYDQWRLDNGEMDAPSCPLCGGEMVEEDDEWLCPECEDLEDDE